MAVVPGQEALVGVAVATLWRSPDSTRPVDAPALKVPPEPGTWARGLSHDEQVHEGVLSQLLLGERVLVQEVRGGWVRGVALDQPAAKLDRRGYPGWLPAAQLTGTTALTPTEVSTVDGGTPYLVDAPTTALRDAPDGAVAMSDIALGTRLVAVGGERDRWLPVAVPGRAKPLWAASADLTGVPADRPMAADVLAFARRLLATTYVWGGVTAHGIDCSGLVHLAWRRYGVILPRDADDQFRASEPIPLGSERPGDLYFFARPGRSVHHIGFVAAPPDGDGEGDRRMVHACYNRRRVISEPVRGERHATLIAAHRIR